MFNITQYLSATISDCCKCCTNLGGTSRTVFKGNRCSTFQKRVFSFKRLALLLSAEGWRGLLLCLFSDLHVPTGWVMPHVTAYPSPHGQRPTNVFCMKISHRVHSQEKHLPAAHVVSAMRVSIWGERFFWLCARAECTI
jgi:hypothetical protein